MYIKRSVTSKIVPNFIYFRNSIRVFGLVGLNGSTDHKQVHFDFWLRNVNWVKPLLI